MPLYKATVDILIFASSEDEAYDAVSETMRPLLQEFGGESFVDWRYHSADGEPKIDDGGGFEYEPRPKAKKG